LIFSTRRSRDENINASAAAACGKANTLDPTESGREHQRERRSELARTAA
jgi:hypothetical protein